MTRNSIRKPSACQSINWSGGGQGWWPTIRTLAAANSSHGWNDANLISVTRDGKDSAWKSPSGEDRTPGRALPGSSISGHPRLWRHRAEQNCRIHLAPRRLPADLRGGVISSLAGTSRGKSRGSRARLVITAAERRAVGRCRRKCDCPAVVGPSNSDRASIQQLTAADPGPLDLAAGLLTRTALGVT